jgi:hypothetical protein
VILTYTFVVASPVAGTGDLLRCIGGEKAMPIYRLLQTKVFDPDAVSAMTAAYEAVLQSIQLIDRTDPLTDIVARRVIDYGAAGERDAIIIRDGVLKELGHTGT